MKKLIFYSLSLALLTTYSSLFIPRAIEVTRSNVMGCEKVCEVTSGGFPVPYIIDGYTSPTGSISQNPLILLFTNTDVFLIKYFLIDYFFWFIMILILLNFKRKISKRKEYEKSNLASNHRRNN